MLAQTVPEKLAVPQDSTAALAIAICLLQGTLLCHHSPIYSQSTNTSTQVRSLRKQPAASSRLPPPRYIHLANADKRSTRTYNGVQGSAITVAQHSGNKAIARGGLCILLKLTSHHCRICPDLPLSFYLYLSLSLLLSLSLSGRLKIYKIQIYEVQML